MFIRKRTYFDLKEQKDRLDRIATDVVAQNDRLLNAWHEDLKRLKQLVDEHHVLRENYRELHHSHEALRDDYEAMARHNQQLEQTITEQEAIVGSYKDLVAERDYLSATCKYYARLLGIDDDRLDTIVTYGEAEE